MIFIRPRYDFMRSFFESNVSTYHFLRIMQKISFRSDTINDHFRVEYDILQTFRGVVATHKIVRAKVIFHLYIVLGLHHNSSQEILIDFCETDVTDTSLLM